MKNYILKQIISKGGMLSSIANIYVKNSELSDKFIQECYEQCDSELAKEIWGEDLIRDIRAYIDSLKHEPLKSTDSKRNLNKHLKINVLLVDDEPNNFITFMANFKNDFKIYFAENAREAEVLLEREQIHVLVTDQRMPIKTGTELLEESVKKYPAQSRILLTAYANTIEIREAFQKGNIFKIIEKPWNDAEVKDAILLGYETFLLKQQLIEIKNDIHKLDNDRKSISK